MKSVWLAWLITGLYDDGRYLIGVFSDEDGAELAAAHMVQEFVATHEDEVAFYETVEADVQ